MKIKKVHIENFRNITFGYVDHLPDFVVIGGANGCGKTTFLEAIFTAKEAVAPYRGFPEPEKNIISTNADNAKILLELEFSEFDKRYAFDNLQIKCPDQAQLFVKFERDGNAITDCPHEVRDLLKKFKLGENAPGFFDYFNAHRRINKTNLSNITLNQSLDDVKRGLSQSEDKYNQTKEYLITLKIRNLLEIEKNLKGNPLTGNNLYEEIVQFFNDFFHPMIFKDIDLSCSPIRFNIETPNGEIELDDLSSGEKEIFHSFVRFHRFSKEGAIVLFDEPDLHLHPEIIKRYLYHLKKISIGNQFIITTHSPEIMLGSDITSLYTIQKTISPERHSQIYQVINDSKRFELLRNTVGSSGIISFNKRIIFIEGEDSSSDLAIYEAYYPPHKNNIKFVPAKNSLGIKQVSKKIEELLSSSIGFQQYYCIIDGDMETSLSDENGLSRLYRLPVYHVENFLVDESKIFNATQKLLREKNPYKEIKEIKEELKALILENSHLNQYTKVLLEADNQKVINDFQTLVYKNRNIQKFEYTLKSFEDIKKKAKAILQSSIESGKWKEKCIGRVLLKSYCGKIKVKYEHLRNLLIDEIGEPSPLLGKIMQEILKEDKITLNDGAHDLPTKNKIDIEKNINKNEISMLIKNSPVMDDHPKKLSGEIEVNDYTFVIKKNLITIKGPDQILLRKICDTLNDYKNHYIASHLESLFEDKINNYPERINQFIQILGIPPKVML